MSDLIKRESVIDLIKADLNRNDLKEPIPDYLIHSLLFRVRALPGVSADQTGNETKMKKEKENE